MSKKNEKMIDGGCKKYVMIVTSEDDRYMNGEKGGKSLTYWVARPWDGAFTDIVYGNDFDELMDQGDYEGLFYYLYCTTTGERVGYGTLDPEGSKEELESYEEYLQRKNFYPDRWHGNKQKSGKYALIVFSTRPHACGRFKFNTSIHIAPDYIRNCPWNGLFEDAVFGNNAEDLHYGMFYGCYYQLFNTETGKCIGIGPYNIGSITQDIETDGAQMSEQTDKVDWNNWVSIPIIDSDFADLNIALEEFKASSDLYAILQLEDTEETAYERYESIAGLERQGKRPNKSHYKLIFSGADQILPERVERLEKLYCIFNTKIPDGFAGHSLSVGDIIVLKEGKEITFNYVDSIGFKKLNNF